MIKFHCVCGKKLKASDDQAGRRAQCSGCGIEVVVPTTTPEPSVVESKLPAINPTSFAPSLLVANSPGAIFQATADRSSILSAGKTLSAGFDSRRQMLSEAQVVPDSARCVQCGICSHNCPMGIDVRGHARRGTAIHDSHCLTCSECVNRCPRGVLRFEQLAVFVWEN